MISLPADKIINPNFGSSMKAVLGDDWEVREEKSRWLIQPTSPNFSFRYFSDISKVHFDTGQIAPAILQALRKVDDPKKHLQLFEAGNTEDLKLKEFTLYGLNAKLFIAKSLFYINPLDAFEAHVNRRLDVLEERYKVRQAIVYRKNIDQISAILSLKRFAYQFSLQESTTIDELNRNAFWSVIPSAFEFGNYLNPFLTFCPVNFAVPLERFTSGVVLIPENTILVPYEANIGFAEILLNAPSNISHSGRFSIFGKKNNLSKVLVRRYIEILLRLMNGLLDWAIHPKTSINQRGEYEPGFGLQLVASINTILMSFIFCARRIDLSERLTHIFNGFDRMANLAVHLWIFRGGIIKEPQVAESKRFERLFDAQFLEDALKIVRVSLDNEDLFKGLKTSSTSALADLDKSVEVLGGSLGERIRIFRRMSHGAFLRKEAFLTNFSKGDARICESIPVLFYLYALCLVANSEEFLKLLGKGDEKIP